MIHTLGPKTGQKATFLGVSYLRRFEIQAAACIQDAGAVFGVLNSNSLIHTRNVETIKSFIDGGTILRIGVLRIRRLTSTSELSCAVTLYGCV